MKKIYFIILSFALVLFGSDLQAQWVQTNGPYGGHINCFAVNGTSIFAGIYYGGVFLSTDNGSIWPAINKGLTNSRIKALAVSGTNIFTGT